MHNKLADKLPILVWIDQQRKVDRVSSPPLTVRARLLKAALAGAMVAATMLLTACAGGATERESNEQIADQSDQTDGTRRSAEDIDPDLLFHALAAERLSAAGDPAEAAEHAYQAALLSDDPEFTRQAVRLAVQQQDWPGMVRAAERWLELEPDYRPALQLIVLAEVNQGHAEAAGPYLVRWLSESRDRQESWPEAAALLGSAERFDAAEATLEFALQALGASEQEALESRSLLLWQQGDSEAAYALALEAVAADASVDGLTWAAQLAAAGEDYESALGHYRQARTLEPDNRDLALAEAEVLRQMDRIDEAVSVLESTGSDADSLYTLGLYLFEAERLDQAREAWQRLADIEPPEDREQASRQAFLTGFLAELLELDEQALAWYEQVSEGDEANQALLRRATLEARLGELLVARNLLEAVRLTERGDLVEQSWLIEAEVLREAGLSDECVEVLSEVLRTSTGNISLLYSRAICAVDADNLELAEQDLRRIIQLDGENAVALNALGYTLTDRTSRHSEALRLIERALEINPDDPATLDSLGWVYYRMGQPEQALEWLERAWSLDKNPEIGAHLAEVLWALGREQAALALLDELAVDHADHVVVRSTRQRLLDDGQ